MTTDTLVLVPAYDEAETIERVVALVRAQDLDVLVIDDGSTDDTAARAERAGAEVLRQAPNRGKGHAVRLGLNVARERGYRFAVTIDGDLEHDPAELPLFLEQLAAGHDLVAGRRDVYRSRSRARLNRFATFWLRQVDPRLEDSTCGFRAFRLAAFADVEIRYDGFEFEPVMLLEAAHRGLSIAFVPVHIASSLTSGVTFPDVLRSNNAFDRWVLASWKTLRLPWPRRLALVVAAAVGLAMGSLVARVAGRRRR